MQRKAMQSNAKQCKAMQSKTKQLKAMQSKNPEAVTCDTFFPRSPKVLWKYIQERFYDAFWKKEYLIRVAPDSLASFYSVSSRILCMGYFPQQGLARRVLSRQLKGTVENCCVPGFRQLQFVRGGWVGWGLRVALV